MNRNLSEERNLRISDDQRGKEDIFKLMNNLLEKHKGQFVPSNIAELANSQLVFFCYAPRCGSTMLSQMLVRTGSFHYISNFNARFWEAPSLSMELEKNLGMRSGLLGYSEPKRSRFGVTSHHAEPHEFGFFWNKWLTSSNHHWIDSNQLEQNRLESLVKTIQSMQAADERPLIVKNGIAGYNVRFLKEVFPKAKFIVIQRDPLFIAQSIYQAREKLYANTKTWWSIRPKNFDQIVEKSKNEFEEIAYQIKAVYDEIDGALIGEQQRAMRVNYETLCESPKEVLKSIINFTSATKNDTLINTFPNFIESSNTVRINPITFGRLKEAIDNVLTL